ncbi:hypothetical protein QCA50_008712 [Cerrena zonata]|uniref:Uncharacterized protein n=1 Tax=Cerrena zonata TaxID=2478898 RepID=A0AAW0GB09_9APHY
MWELTTSDIAALAIFISYFSLILGLFALIYHSLPTPTKSVKNGTRNYRAYAFGLLTIGSFAHTWFYMFKFLSWSFVDYESRNIAPSASFLPRLVAWLKDTQLFEQAWAAVCEHPLNWWWSEQLCIFTVGAWTLFLAIQGRNHSVKRVWAYMVLGQLVAISVATNLFFFALSLAPKQVKVNSAERRSTQYLTRVPLALAFCVLISLGTVVLSPFTSERTFLPNLLTMHTLIAIPLLPNILNAPPSKKQIATKTVYTIALVVGVALRLKTTYIAFTILPEETRSIGGFVSALITTLYSHPAQSSIGWDVIWTSISFLVWIALGHTPSQAHSPGFRSIIFLPFTALTAALSIGVSAPIALLSDLPHDIESKSD